MSDLDGSTSRGERVAKRDRKQCSVWFHPSTSGICVSIMFQLGKRMQGETRLLGIRGDRALGSFRLRCEVQLVFAKQPGDDKVAIVDLCGDMGLRFKTENPHHLGRVYQSDPQPVIYAGASHTCSVGLCIDLSSTQLEAIEERRLGRGLDVILRLSGVGSSADGFFSIGDTASLQVNQGTWIEVLERMGYRHTMLLEIPMPIVTSATPMTNAIDHLRAAQEYMLRGEWRQSVAATRDVMESIALVHSRVESGDSELEVLFRNMRSRKLPERIALLRRALQALAGAAKHADADASQIEWGREDAVFAVCVASALVRRTALSSS